MTHSKVFRSPIAEQELYRDLLQQASLHAINISIGALNPLNWPVLLPQVYYSAFNCLLLMEEAEVWARTKLKATKTSAVLARV